MCGHPMGRDVPDAMTASIFISYASQDLKVASTLCKALEGRGFKCWISSRDVLPGENFQVAIVRAIRGAKMMLLVFTGNSNNSEEMTKELVLASQNRLIVVPLRIEDVTPNEAFAYEFATRQWIDFFADWEAWPSTSCRCASPARSAPRLSWRRRRQPRRSPGRRSQPSRRLSRLGPSRCLWRAQRRRRLSQVATPPAAVEVVTAEVRPAPAPVPPPAIQPTPEPARVEVKPPAKLAAAAGAATAAAKPADQPVPGKPAAPAPSAKVDPKAPPPAKPAAAVAVEGEPRKGPPIALLVGLGVVILLIIGATSWS